MGIDFLGDATKPIINSASKKIDAALKFFWLQPYGGYATGRSDQSRTTSAGATTSESNLKIDGLVYGGRGGLQLARSLRFGLDFSIQQTNRTTLMKSPSGSYIQQSVTGKNSMLGLCAGFDIPFTPLQGFAAKYVKANISGDATSVGDGWGAGVSFVLKTPFILLVETRKLKYDAGISVPGNKASASATIQQTYVALSFMLL